jgi:hypothetical protein
VRVAFEKLPISRLHDPGDRGARAKGVLGERQRVDDVAKSGEADDEIFK